MTSLPLINSISTAAPFTAPSIARGGNSSTGSAPILGFNGTTPIELPHDYLVGMARESNANKVLQIRMGFLMANGTSCLVSIAHASSSVNVELIKKKQKQKIFTEISVSVNPGFFDSLSLVSGFHIFEIKNVDLKK